MKQTEDKFYILKNSIELLEKHMALDTVDQRSKGISPDVSLELRYNDAFTALMLLIKKQISQIRTIPDLQYAFRDSVYGVAALGLRQDLLHNTLLGETKSGQTALCDAIKKDIDTDSQPIWGMGLGCCDNSSHMAMDLSIEAFAASTIIDSGDRKALALMILLDYTINNGYKGLDIVKAIGDLEYSSCLKHIIADDWSKRSLVGYYESYTYVIDGANKEFIGLFATKLKELLAKEQSAQVLQIKQYLHEQVIVAWSGDNFVKPLDVYMEIEELIAASKTSANITGEIADSFLGVKDFAVHTRFGESGVSYEVNAEGLTAFVELLEALGLGDLQEVSMTIGKIRDATKCLELRIPR